ncbi:AbrB/MazE/SpoVT family DNA-binding domain-containing protein [Sphingomonas sp. GB1N7]|uniref:AbrB/MazE/SpoVT family DNA-binding domain-containing protein n=1 Tax=Parasphingomonas caseinilytica TaxID=3096158 RepID=UPI002FC82375
MDDEYLGKTFKSGNSVALRLPKGMGIAEGTELRMVREAPMSFRIEPVDAPKRKVDLTGIWGSCPGLEPLLPEDRVFDHSPRVWDDPDWEGWSNVPK